MANIASPWRYNICGAPPVLRRFPVAVGTTRTISIGDMCYMDNGDSDLVAVAASTDNLHAIVIANEEQKATDAERFIWCIVPTQFDVFEYPLDAATQAYFGLECQIDATNSDAQTLKISTTDPVATVVDVEDSMPETGATQPTVSTVKVVFKHAGKSTAGVDLPWLGTHIGDTA